VRPLSKLAAATICSVLVSRITAPGCRPEVERVLAGEEHRHTRL